MKIGKDKVTDITSYLCKDLLFKKYIINNLSVTDVKKAHCIKQRKIR